MCCSFLVEFEVVAFGVVVGDSVQSLGKLEGCSPDLRLVILHFSLCFADKDASKCRRRENRIVAWAQYFLPVGGRLSHNVFSLTESG